MPNARASGRATTPTVRPATRSAVNSAVIAEESVEEFGSKGSECQTLRIPESREENG